MTAPRECFLQTLNFEPADPPFVRSSSAWPETFNLWMQQGWDGRSLEEIFGLDTFLPVEVYYGPAPEWPYEVLEEDDRTRTYVNHEGIQLRVLKDIPPMKPICR